MKQILPFFFVSVIFAQSEIQNPLELQIQNVNFQAGKKVISTSPAKFNKPKLKISSEEFEKTKYKELLKPYIPQLTKLSSKELAKLIEANKDLIAYYKANKIFLTLLAYQTGKDLDRYIDTLEKVNGNRPMFGKVLTVAWVERKEKIQEKVGNTGNIKKGQGQKSEEGTKEIEVRGYCTFPNKVVLYTKPFYVKTICYFDNGEEGYLFGQVIPDLGEKMVKFKPIMFEDINGKRYLTKPILVLNAEKSSPNIATSVNERELEKVLAKATQSSMQDTKEMLKDYFKNQGTTVQVNGDVVIENKEYSLADIGSFALKDFLASLVEAGADLINKKLSNIPVIFTIEKGTVFYVDLILIPLKNKK